MRRLRRALVVIVGAAVAFGGALVLAWPDDAEPVAEPPPVTEREPFGAPVMGGGPSLDGPVDPDQQITFAAPDGWLLVANDLLTAEETAARLKAAGDEETAQLMLDAAGVARRGDLHELHIEPRSGAVIAITGVWAMEEGIAGLADAIAADGPPGTETIERTVSGSDVVDVAAPGSPLRHLVTRTNSLTAWIVEYPAEHAELIDDRLWIQFLTDEVDH